MRLEATPQRDYARRNATPCLVTPPTSSITAARSFATGESFEHFRHAKYMPE
ncbi:hypothetical protein CHS0354_031484, partial [Potamilus streckersoni]